MTLDELLAAASAADGMTRINFRDEIAAYGETAIPRLEPWLRDSRLARFAVLTIERVAGDPGARASAVESLQRARGTCAESALEDCQAALARLGSRPGASSSGARSIAQRTPISLVPAPPMLHSLVFEWRAAGSPAQPCVLWPRDLWLTDLPKHAELFRALPTLLGRADVRSVCANATSDAMSAERALVAVMAWGMGNVGYARFRTTNILLTPHATDRLLSVAQTLTEAGPVAAYRRLADRRDCGLDGLGPAFGTKYLYFCQPTGADTMALILDKLVSGWLQENAGLELPSQPWSEVWYDAYLRQMHTWATELDCASDELEQCIFRSKADESGGQWSARGIQQRPQRRAATHVPRVAPASPTTVELGFHQAMLDIYQLAGRQTGYWAGYFLRTVRDEGGLATCRKLLGKSGTSEGFERLKKEGRLDLSMEAVMLRPEFGELFSTEELARASDRLAAHGYPAPRMPRDGDD